MTSPIHEILSPLQSHWDRVVRRPMSKEQIDELQQQLDVKIPELFKDYLGEIGLFQDLTSWGNSAIELYEQTNQFVSARAFLVEQVKPKTPELFPFGHDGAGDVYGLPTDPDVPCRIHFFDHEAGKVSKKKDFTLWLESVVKKVMRGIRKRPLNEHKVWAVQFSFDTTGFAELLELLATLGDVKQIDSDWTNEETSPADVTSSERRIEFNGDPMTVARLEFDDWDAPMFSFDMQEPVLTEIEHSTIRKLDALFKQNCPDYKLIDYRASEMNDE